MMTNVYAARMLNFTSLSTSAAEYIHLLNRFLLSRAL